MTSPVAFGPNSSKTKIISGTATSSSVTLDATDVQSTPSPANSGPSGGHSVMRLVNAGPNTAFVRWGIGAQTALATDMPLLAGVTEVFSKSGADDTVAAICAATQTATVYVTCGEGI